jgi:hypothetical protein
MTAGLDPEMLRVLVREALADLLPPPAGPVQAGSPAAPPGPGGTAPAQPVPANTAPEQEGAAYTVRDGAVAVQTVSLRTDQELAAFVTRLLHLFENPRRRDDLRSGRLRFRLAPGSAGGAAGPAGSARPVRRIDQGAVTEAAVRDAARAGARLVLGRRAVLTPLARDRARAAGVEIEKER